MLVAAVVRGEEYDVMNEEVFLCLSDSGANIMIANKRLSEELSGMGFKVVLCNAARQIQTADKKAQLQINGWIDVGGYIGKMAVCFGANESLLSVSKLANNGVAHCFGALPNQCDLSLTVREKVITKGSRKMNNLFYVDIRELMDNQVYAHLCDVQENTTYEVNSAKVVTRGPSVNRKVVMSLTLQKEAHDFHARLLHRSFGSIAHMLRTGLITEIDTKITAAQMEAMHKHFHCWVCMMAKKKKSVVKIGSNIKPRIGNTWSYDYQGPFHPPTYGGHTGKIWFVCVRTGYLVVFMVKVHDAAAVIECFRQVQLKCRQHNWEVEYMRPDAGAVEMSKFVKEQAQNMGITVLPGSVEHQEQDPVERYIQTADNGIAAITLDQDLLGPKWWDYATYSYVEGSNAMSNSLCPESSPMAEFEMRQLNLATMLKFSYGQPCVVARTKPDRSGVSKPRNEFGIVVTAGCRPSGAVLVYLPEHKNHFVGVRLDVHPIKLGQKPEMSEIEGKIYLPVFEDGRWLLKSRGENSIFARDVIYELKDEEEQSPRTEKSISINSSLEMQEVEMVDGVIHDESSSRLKMSEHTSRFENGVMDLDDGARDETQLRRSGRRNQGEMPTRFAARVIEEEAYYSCQAAMSIELGEDEAERMLAFGATKIMADRSVSFEHLMAFSASKTTDDYLWRHPTMKKAERRSDAHMWIEAKMKELSGLEEKTCITFLDKDAADGGLSLVPRGMQIMPTGFTCLIKKDDSYKVRLYEMGNLERATAGDTFFAPTVSAKALWLLTACALLLGLEKRQYDIGNAFCSEDCPREKYFNVDGKICRSGGVNGGKQFYGAKDAPAIFNKGWVDHLRKEGYKQSMFELGVFVKFCSISVFIWILLHVDDFTVWSQSKKELDNFHEYLLTKYEKVKRTDGGLFLGINEQKYVEGSIFTKPANLQIIFDNIIPEGPTWTSKHLISNPSAMTKEYIEQIEEPAEKADISLGKSWLGLLHQQLPVRPDTVFAIQKVGTRVSKDFNVRDLEAMKHIANYLYYTREKGLFLAAGNNNQDGRELSVTLQGYADCAGATGSDSKMQYCICTDVVLKDRNESNDIIRERSKGTGKINTKSFKAPTVDLAMTEGEIGALVEETKDIIWQQNLMNDLGLEQKEPTTIFNDNASGIHLVTKYDGKHKKVRYCLGKINFCLDKVKEQIVKYSYMRSEDLPPDAGTKLLVGAELKRKSDLMLGNIPERILTPYKE